MAEENREFTIVPLDKKSSRRKYKKPDLVEEFTFQTMRSLIPPSSLLGMSFDCALWIGLTGLAIACVPDFVIEHEHTPILFVLALFILALVLIYALKVVPSASYLLLYRGVLFVSGLVVGVMSHG